MERDEHIFAYVMDELENGVRNEALWIKGFSVAEGKENKHKALYLQYRVEEIKSVFKNNNINYIECSKDKINEYIENDFKNELAPEWMRKLWEWADKYSISDINSKKIEELASLKKLSVYSSDVAIIPKEIGNLSKLEELYITWCNNITKIPKEIGKLSNLEILELADNSKLRTIPKEIGNLLKLRTLNFCVMSGKHGAVNSTTLDSLPKELSNLINLKYICICGSNLKDIPDELFNIPELCISVEADYIHVIKEPKK